MTLFKELLCGAYAMDCHFLNEPFESNRPVLLAMPGIWYRNFWDAQAYAFLPCDHYLRNFVKHLQQMDMESSGKSIRQTKLHASGAKTDRSMSFVVTGQVLDFY